MSGGDRPQLILPGRPEPSQRRELHPPEALRPGAWWACQHPERRTHPPSVDMAVDFLCPDCRVVAAAYAAVDPGLGVTTRTRSGVEVPTELNLSQVLDGTRRHDPEGKDHRT